MSSPAAARLKVNAIKSKHNHFINSENLFHGYIDLIETPSGLAGFQQQQWEEEKAGQCTALPTLQINGEGVSPGENDADCQGGRGSESLDADLLSPLPIPPLMWHPVPRTSTFRNRMAQRA
ncbi:hypothetical protein E2C01_068917 [Portunus trituberculatus]|uniref:Uncharacterized protein n=1 Tax=Portunus trituberculatus TaxID=210409 RepID=A0A5B7I1F3_PORTR|nr:hypothetical protein [Portunus trituberculatus]